MFKDNKLVRSDLKDVFNLPVKLTSWKQEPHPFGNYSLLPIQPFLIEEGSMAFPSLLWVGGS